MKRVAIYMRVSTDRQAQEGDSIPAQRDALRKYIDERPDLVFGGEYLDDGISGQKYAQRDELQRLLDDVRGKKIDLIIFTKLDRWFRSVRHYTATQEILDRQGVGWLAIWEPIYDTTTPAGRLIVNQMMSIAQFEAENTGQRIRQVQSYKVSQGEVISGSCLFGYKIEGKRMVLDEQAAPVMREVFRMFSETASQTDCVRYIERETGKAITKPHLKGMLTNTKYIGLFRGNPDFCPPIVDQKLFEDVQRKLTIGVKCSQKYDYIFSGLMRCTCCGAKMAALTDSHLRNGKRYRRPLYRCVKHYQYGLNLCQNSHTIMESTVEKYLLGNVRGLAETTVAGYQIEEAPRKSNEAKIAAVQKKLDRLKDLYVNELITLDQYKEDAEHYRADIESLRAETVEQRDTSALDAILHVDLGTVYQTMTNNEKRYFWRSVIREIRFSSDKTLEIIFL